MVAVAHSAPVASEKPLTERWLDLSKVSSSFRYRQAFNEGSAKIFDDGQQQMVLINRFKLDRNERYTINLRASSGGYFNWSYADVAGMGFGERQHKGLTKSSYNTAQAAERKAAGPADPAGLLILTTVVPTGWHFLVRELYFSATPVRAVTVEFGSLGLERGYSSEITSFDDDGWVSGERFRIKDPKHLFFNEIGFTNAYFGNISTPNFFDRGSDLTSSNYRQIFGKKQLNKYLAFSVDYTYLAGTDTVREAVAVDTRATKVIDKINFEAYQRLNTVNLQGLDVQGGSGFAVTAEKKITDRLTGGLGFADVDSDYSVYTGHRVQHAVGMSMNGDSYGQGKRPFMHASYKLNPVVTAFGFYTHALYDNQALTLNQQNLNAGLTFDLKALANTGKRIF